MVVGIAIKVWWDKNEARLMSSISSTAEISFECLVNLQELGVDKVAKELLSKFFDLLEVL